MTAKYNLYATLYKDEPEELVFTGTENDCMFWFHKNTNYSYTNALKSGLARLELTKESERELYKGSGVFGNEVPLFN